MIQTKVDTRGENYALALQHMLVGVYISELCLLGLLGVSKKSGPSVLMIILLILTVLYHITTNRVLSPLEEQIPSDLLSSNEEEEETSLLDPEVAPGQGTSEHDPLVSSLSGTPAQPRQEFPSDSTTISRILTHLSSRFHRIPFLPLPTVAALKQLFDSVEEGHDHGHDGGGQSQVSYTEEQLRTAYLQPELTSKLPKLWLVRDRPGLSKKEMEENDKSGIPTTDEGAWLDEKGKVRWDHEDISTVPIFKKPTSLY